MNPDDTICAPATPPAPGRRAILRVAGPGTRAVLARLTPHPLPARGVAPGVPIRLDGFHRPIPVDIYLWQSPRSYTAQDAAELHLISSGPVVEALAAAVLSSGARPAGPGEFTARAFLAGKKDLTQAEAVLAVIEAPTDADLKTALTQLAGGVTGPLKQVRTDLLDLLADTEAALDFADEDIEFVTPEATLLRITAALARLANLARQLAERADSRRRMRVTLVGPPNAGKSSLFNALLGDDAAIVSPTAGTTRDYLTVETVIGRVPVELTDTAGLGDAADAIDAESQQLGRDQAGRSDVLVWCVPVVDLPPRHAPPPGRVVRVATQADRSIRPAPPGWTPVSIVAPDGLTALRLKLEAEIEQAAAPPLAPSQSRLKAHVHQATAALKRAHEHARESDPPELLALALREALHEIGAMTGEVHTEDLLERIFSRFCIGK